MQKLNKKSKKALSEIISYVLLIVIAMSLALGVYAWLKFIVPSENEKESCPVDAALRINNISCTPNSDLIYLLIENSGNFKLSGFYIKASNNSQGLFDAILLSHGSGSPGQTMNLETGAYYFNVEFNPRVELKPVFNYSNSLKLKKIQIQPFVNTKNNQISLCNNIIEVPVQINCD